MTGGHALVGDPASASALAATMRRSSGRLRREADRVESALAAVGDGWVGPTAREHRRRATGVAEVLSATARLLDESSAALQRAATDLADHLADLAALEEEAARHGLEVRDGMVARGWGIVGVVPESSDGLAGPDEVRARLDERLHGIASALGRSRARLVRECTGAGRTLEAVRELL